MDVYSRRIIGYSVAEDMRAEHNINALNMALKTRGIKDYKFQLIHHSDKGGQYASDVYTNMLTQYNIGISMCNEVYENTHIERLNDTIKNQYLNRFEMNSKYELVQKLRLVVDTYNNKRPHMSLDGLTPIQYEKNLAKNDKAQNKEMTIFTSEQSKIINGNIQMQLFSN